MIAVTRSEAKQRLARELGADVVIGASDGDPVPAAREAAGGYGADVVVQCVGDARVDEQAIAMGGPGGRVVLIGAALEPFSVRAVEIFWRELSVLGSRGFIPADIEDAIDLYLDGTLSVDHLTDAVATAGRGRGGARGPARRTRVPLGPGALNLAGPAARAVHGGRVGRDGLRGRHDQPRVGRDRGRLFMLQAWGSVLTIGLYLLGPRDRHRRPTGWSGRRWPGVLGIVGLACMFLALSRSADGSRVAAHRPAGRGHPGARRHRQRRPDEPRPRRWESRGARGDRGHLAAGRDSAAARRYRRSADTQPRGLAAHPGRGLARPRLLPRDRPRPRGRDGHRDHAVRRCVSRPSRLVATAFVVAWLAGATPGRRPVRITRGWRWASGLVASVGDTFGTVTYLGATAVRARCP